MPAPYPTKLKMAAVSAFESGEGTANEIAAQFEIGVRTLSTWCRQLRERGTLEPAQRGGGNFSRVDVPRLLKVMAERRDATTDEITRVYNSGQPKRLKVHRSSILRALRREGFVFKKNGLGQWNKIGRTSVRSGKHSAVG
jgi:transposase